MPRVKQHTRKVNPYAVCHASIGPRKTAKFERCVRDVKAKEGWHVISDTNIPGLKSNYTQETEIFNPKTGETLIVQASRFGDYKAYIKTPTHPGKILNFKGQDYNFFRQRPELKKFAKKFEGR